MTFYCDPTVFDSDASLGLATVIPSPRPFTVITTSKRVRKERRGVRVIFFFVDNTVIPLCLTWIPF